MQDEIDAISLESTRAFLAAQVDRMKRPMLESRFPSHELYLLAYGRLSAAKDIRAEFDRFVREITEEKD